jgi:hypothetical protein
VLAVPRAGELNAASRAYAALVAADAPSPTTIPVALRSAPPA